MNQRATGVCAGTVPTKKLNYTETSYYIRKSKLGIFSGHVGGQIYTGAL